VYLVNCHRNLSLPLASSDHEALLLLASGGIVHDRMIELHELHYTKAELANAPEKDRLFYLMATGLANDLQTLMKLFAVAVSGDREPIIVNQGNSTVGMLMLRLLAGRLWEGAKLLDNIYGAIEDDYHDELGPEARRSLATLRKYFKNRRNLVAMVRDKIGFHAEEKIVKRALDRIPDDSDMGDYLCRTTGNTLYYSAEILHYEAINFFTGGAGQPASLHTLVGDVQKLVGHFNTFIYGFAALFLRRHLGRQLNDMRDRKTTLENVARFDDLTLPYFTELPIPDTP
jgi:hypothetical protein